MIWEENWHDEILSLNIENINPHSNPVSVSDGDIICCYVSRPSKSETVRICIDPPDSTTPYTHMHIYDEFSNPLDIGGKIVDRKHPSAHIPWNGKDR